MLAHHCTSHHPVLMCAPCHPAGVMDERGKFIHISAEEMAAVADFIRRRGRVAIAELAARSNHLVDLAPRSAAAGGGEAASSAPALDFDSLLGEVAA